MTNQPPKTGDEELPAKQFPMATDEDGSSENSSVLPPSRPAMDEILTYRSPRFENVPGDGDDRTERFHAEFPSPQLAFSPTFTLDVTTRVAPDVENLVEEKDRLRARVMGVRAGFALISTERIGVSDPDLEVSEDELGEASGMIVFEVGLLEPIEDKTSSFHILMGLDPDLATRVSGSDKDVYRSKAKENGRVVATDFWIVMSGEYGATARVVRGDGRARAEVSNRGESKPTIRGEKMIVSAAKGTVHYTAAVMWRFVR